MKFKILNKMKSFFNNFKEHSNTAARENLQKNFLKKENSLKNESNDFMKKKNQSMSDSQGVSDFSGSGYNGPGNVDREKVNSNMSQRNFENS